MTTLFFDTLLSGHHLEYLHHYYLIASKLPNENFVFVVPEEFKEKRKNYTWETLCNVSFEFIDSDIQKRIDNETNIYKKGWLVSKLLRYVVCKLSPDKVFLTMLMQYIPFILFLLPRNVRVEGILYKIYLYRKKQMGFMRLLFEKLRFRMMSKSKIISSVYILNDAESAKSLNSIYRTKKFKAIVDPVPQISFDKLKNIRKDLDIPDDYVVYLHFGGLAKRKGTVEILKAIIEKSHESLKNRTYIFAGKVAPDIKKEFYTLLDRAKNNTRILVFDEFCSYEFIYNLCFSSDIILMPYQFTDLSSGILGYASLFNKPVIGPKGGLIGRLIEQNKLGITISDVSCFGLKDVINETLVACKNDYASRNSVQNFINTIIA